MKQKVIDYAIQVFGNNHTLAMNWLQSFNPALETEPIKLLDSRSGCDQVLNILVKIEEQHCI